MKEKPGAGFLPVVKAGGSKERRTGSRGVAWSGIRSLPPTPEEGFMWPTMSPEEITTFTWTTWGVEKRKWVYRSQPRRVLRHALRFAVIPKAASGLPTR